MRAVGLAEIGDKTQLSILLLSSRTREYARLLLGVMLAFLLADGFSILVGSYVNEAIFATEYDPHLVFVGVMTARFMLTLAAIFLGKHLASRIDRRLMSKVAGGVFILIGLFILITGLSPAIIAAGLKECVDIGEQEELFALLAFEIED
ncbi:MAG: TMEM165/GDT1 family protein [Methanothrix sp.]